MSGVIFNGSDINDIDKIVCDGVTVTKQFFNGVQFWPKTSVPPVPEVDYLWERITTLPTTQLREAPKWHGDGKWIAIKCPSDNSYTNTYYTSNDDGDTWLTHTLPQQFITRGQYASIASNGNGTIMISNQQILSNGNPVTNQILVSTDNGQTWGLSGSMPSYSTQSGLTQVSRLYYYNNNWIAWSESMPFSVMRKSTNNGASWSKILESGDALGAGMKAKFNFGKTLSNLGQKYSLNQMTTIKTAPEQYTPLLCDQNGIGLYADNPSYGNTTIRKLNGLSSGNLVFSQTTYNVPFTLINWAYPNRGLAFDNTGLNTSYFQPTYKSVQGVDKYAVANVEDIETNIVNVEELPQQPNVINNDPNTYWDWQYGSKENENQTWMLLLKDNYLYRRKHI